MKINLTYSVDEKLIPDFYSEVLGYYGLSAKNIRNSALFIIKNLFSSYHYEKDSDSYFLKNNLHSEQANVLNYINQTIESLNTKLKNKFDKNKQDNNKLKKPKLVQFNLYSEIIDKDTYHQILDKSLLENVIKTKELISKFKDYTIVHSHLAQSVVHKLCDDFSHYYKAVKQYSKSKDNFTGKPQQPDYKHKNSAISFDISIQRFNNDGTVLLIGKKHKLYTDYSKINLINNELIDKFNSFNLLEAINKDIENKGLSQKIGSNVDYKIAGVRVIPGKFNRKPKIEYIITYEKELQGFYPDLLAKSIKEKNKDFFKLKDNDKLSLIKDYFNNSYATNNPNNPIPYFMGIDLGLVNFASVSLFSQNRDLNYVISGRTLKNKIIKIDTKIDDKKSELTIGEIENIQSKKDNFQQLTREELRQLKEFYKEQSLNPTLVKYQLRKTDITTDFIHKLSKALIQDCLSKGIKVIIVGKNKGQKNEINIGKSNNRDMYNFPHARFVEILKYKAMLKDILVIETEESYTSKTSFIDNEKLSEYSLDKKTTQDTKHQLSGKRINQKFITKNGVRLHADINGSFNIVRKVLLNFTYDKKQINLKYNLMELSLSSRNKFYQFHKNKHNCGTLANPVIF